jgi:uncharacterized protein (DUF1778 family)
MNPETVEEAWRNAAWSAEEEARFQALLDAPLRTQAELRRAKDVAVPKTFYFTGF